MNRIEIQRMNIHDPIHGSLVEIPKKFMDIVRSREFQRMRNVRQNGTLYHVYPSANHTRYEHMLGTAYLTKIFMNNLVMFGPDRLTVTEKDEIYLAALLHDIGHAPFSHQFESQVCKALNLEFSHEEFSKDIIMDMIDKYNITNVNGSNIIGLINGEIINTEKPWMSEIVANKRNCIDVDKFDYLQRDPFYIYGEFNKNTFTMLMRRPCVYEGQICYPEKYEDCVSDMFSLRHKMYKKAYMHSKVISTGYMYADAILKANHVLNIKEYLNDRSLFSNFDDNVINWIQNNGSPSLRKSKEILNRVINGKYYVETKRYINIPEPTLDDLRKCNMDGKLVKDDDIIIHKYKLNYGRKNNPIYDVTFYRGNRFRDMETSTIQESVFHPRVAEESVWQLFCKNTKNKDEIISMAETWASAHMSRGRE